MATSESTILEIKEVSTNVEEALTPLRALEAALAKRISVKTSLIQLREYDGNRKEFIDIDGVVTDEETLEILEESVSDIISIEKNENTWNVASKSASAASRGSREISTGKLVAGLEGTAGAASCSVASVSAGKTGDDGGGGGSFYSIPSCCSNFEGILSPETVTNAEHVIADLEANGPAGLVHLSSLSAAIGKPLRVWSSGGTKGRMVGKTRIGEEPVDIEYHEPCPNNPQGHWTLRGNVEPRDTEGQLNDCLFSVVADQVNSMAPELRTQTIAQMRTHVRSLAHRIDVIAKKEKCERISLLIGGASYNGQRPQDAAKVIDASQQGHCHPDGRSGHPRGHASYPQATGPTDSVENYSRGGWKSGFLSRQDQDAVGHLVLETQQAQNAMQQLNAGTDSIALRLGPSDLEPGALPEAAEYVNGQQQGPSKSFKQLVMVLRHHVGEKNNPGAEVFIHTFYPVLK